MTRTAGVPGSIEVRAASGVPARLAVRLAPGVPAGEGVSVVTIGQWPGFLLAGPAVGLAAGVTSLRVALLALVAAGLGAALLAGRTSVPS
ncbi:hypothetical protein [Streptomyces barringtoniae]|uniref:hypothetical protein n=1 Tax=Streptomyces barringtoniae TaxID=2892029 RepID=UPI001E41CD23|nr:hypothetical protein [Streptomyces barringtoniae]MCC5473692.1 hypothetical protein [Streptomyces barringtoniae]